MAQTLKECIADFLKSKEIQDYVKAVVSGDKGMGSSIGTQFAKARAAGLAEELADILREEIQHNDILSERAKEVFLPAIRTGIYYDNDYGAWIAMVYFDRKLVKRRSWLNEGPDAKIQDPLYDFDIYIPILFNSGYTAQNYVYKRVGSKTIRSKIHREPSRFLENAKAEFDKRHRKDGLFALINENYEADSGSWREANDDMFD